MKKKSNNRQDAYEVVTNAIVKMIEEQGVLPWSKPWNVKGVLPYNVVSKKTYRGMNQLLLGSVSSVSPVWGTFKQWKDKGGFVRKGEKGMPVVFWKFLGMVDDDKNPILDSKGNQKTIPLIRYSTVFNATQIDGIDLEKYIPDTKDVEREFTPIETAEQIVENMPNCPPIVNKGDRAYYTPFFDEVTMPKPEQFKTNDKYYNVLFHELGHATGHESRVGRELSQMEEKYSFEELIAELTACFVSTEAGISIDIENSASYIAGWNEKLKSDPKMIVKAASKAKKAAEYILNTEKGE